MRGILVEEQTDMGATLVLALLVFLAVPSHAADADGSADHPLIPRYEDSEIVKYGLEEFTDFRLMVAAATQYGGIDKHPDAALVLEGQGNACRLSRPGGQVGAGGLSQL
jgi:hypothetical protein